MSAATPDVYSPSSPLSHGPSSIEWNAAHDEIRANDALWQSLAFDGVQHDGRGGLLENRRCPRCASTLSRPVTLEKARKLCQQQAVVHALSNEALSDARQVRPKSRRGFAAMPIEKLREIARLGGQTSHRVGGAHRFTSEQARDAGRRGGQAVSADKQHMSEIGRRGGIARRANRRSRPS